MPCGARLLVAGLAALPLLAACDRGADLPPPEPTATALPVDNRRPVPAATGEGSGKGAAGP